MQPRAFLQRARQRAGQRDLQPIQNPGDAERHHHAGMKAAPAQLIEPRRYAGFDDAIIVLTCGHGIGGDLIHYCTVPYCFRVHRIEPMKTPEHPSPRVISLDCGKRDARDPDNARGERGFRGFGAAELHTLHRMFSCRHPPSRGLCISRAPMISLLRRRFAGGTDGGAADRTIELYGRSGERSRARQRTVAADGGTGGLVCGRSVAGRLAQRIDGRAGLSCACAVQGVAVAAMVWIVRSGLEEALLDRLSFRRFLGLSLSEPVPDHSTLWRFREQLAKSGLAERAFGLITAQIEKSGFVLKRGTLIDASLVRSAVGSARTAGRPIATGSGRTARQ